MTVISRYLQRVTSGLLLTVGALMILAPVSAQESKVASEDSSGRLFHLTDGAADTGALTDKDISAFAGDTFQLISKREFDSVKYWRHLAEYNQLPQDTKLTAGQIVKIPRIDYRPREFAEVVYAHGDNLYIQADGSGTRKLERNEKIFLEDEIRTGETGFATVAFRTGASINLQPSSHVKLIKLNCLATDTTCFIELSSAEGQLVIDVPKRTDVNNQENVFHVDTPHASAAVRGTHFDIGSSPEGMLLGVTEGTVSVIANTVELPLPLGFGIKAQQNTPLGEPIKLLPATSIKTVPSRVAAPDLIAANAIEGAVSYEWKLSSDPAGSQVLSQIQTEQAIYQLANVEAGTYYLHVRGLDTNGLKGFEQASKISVAGIDTSFAPIALEAERSGQDLLISVINPPEEIPGYEIQLSVNAEFDDPVSVDVGSAGAVIFSQQQDAVFVRARGLITPSLITPFGPVLPIR